MTTTCWTETMLAALRGAKVRGARVWARRRAVAYLHARLGR